jgi:hypothetical protein
MFAKLKTKIFERFAAWCIRRAVRHPHEHRFHDDGRRLMSRYWLFRIGNGKAGGDGSVCPWFAIQVNQLISSEEPIFHDEPCHSTYLVLRGQLCEATPRDIGQWRDHIETITRFNGFDPVQYDVGHVQHFVPGDRFKRKAWDWHFFTLPNGGDAWTLQITGPRRQMWGYLADGLVKVPWRIFMDRRRQRRGTGGTR